MNRPNVYDAAHLLLQSRIDQKRIRQLPDKCRPTNEKDAYNIQDLYVERMLEHYGGEIVGYKAGCTNVSAQKQLGISSPFCGPLLSPFVLTSPAIISSNDGFMRMIEAEIGFRVKYDLPATETLYDAKNITPALTSAFGAIEVVDSRYEDWTTAGAPQLIADNVCCGFWVYGSEINNIENMDWINHSVKVSRNGIDAEIGNSSNVLKNPLNVVAWLANHLNARGKKLEAGHLITTGTMIEVNPAQSGDIIIGEYDKLGSVKITFN